MLDTDMPNEDRATAFVIGALSPAERDEVARERLYNRALDEHIRLAERLFARMQPAPLPTRRPAADWSRIEHAIAREQAALAGKKVEECSDGEWQVHGPGIEFKLLWSGGTALIRCNPGASEDVHDQPHDLDEHMLIVAGDLDVGGRRFGTGDYLCMPAGSVHPRMETHGGCLLFAQYRAPEDPRSGLFESAIG